MAVSATRADPLLPEVAAFIGQTRRMLIDGQLVEAADGASFETVDPTNGDTLTRLRRLAPSTSTAPSPRRAGHSPCGRG